MGKKPYDHAFQYKDVPTIGETFADGIHQIQVDGTTLRITFTVSRGDAPKSSSKDPPVGVKATAARLVMPLPALATLYNQLERMVRGLEQQGLLQRSPKGLKTTSTLQ